MACIPTIVIHGGAWAIPDKLAKQSEEGVQAAAKIGYEILMNGGSAVDAVEAAVVSMEDDPAFDAGRGSVLNSLGEVEMDAVIMDGEKLSAGAVACVQNIPNPIKLARLVMEKSAHTLIVGKGANKFAKDMGIKQVSTDDLVTSEAKEEWKTFMQFHKTVDVLFRDRDNKMSGHDTVGAVAIDKNGGMAFATSTGGITAKYPGRVGDSPIIGSGGYCDNNIGAVSSTGHGEAISKVCLARHVTGLLDQGLNAQKAAESALSFMSKRVGGTGGVIVLDKNGNIGKHFNTERMAWASIQDDKLYYGLNPGENHMVELK